MKRLLLLALLLGSGTAGCGAADDESARADVEFRTAEVADRAADFEPPVRLKAGAAAIRVESPGYAAPCWADINGDGQMALLVGQFKKGKIQVFQHLEAEKFAPGQWLEADGEIAEVPGVW